MTYSSEVLADSPLAYWRLGDAVVGITATASTYYSVGAGEPPANAIDGNASTYWTTAAQKTGWLRLQYSTPQALTSYGIRRRDDIPARNATAWTFEGSNDGTTFTVLDTQTGITWPTAGETKNFTFANTTAYLYYRLNISANGGDTYLSVADLATVSPPPLADASGNGRTLALTGGVASVAGLLTGDTDTALSFPGAGYAKAAAYASWMSPSAVTVEAVIQTTAADRLILNRDEVSVRAFQFRVNSAGFLEFITIAGGAGVITASATTALLTDGVRHHVAATYDASNIRLYVDGALVKTQAAVGALSTQAAPVAIGANFSGGGPSNLFNGTIDEAAYYGTALSGTRIAAHAAAMSAGGVPTTTGMAPVGVGSSARTSLVATSSGMSPVSVGSSSATSIAGAIPVTNGTSPVTVASSSATSLVESSVTTTGTSPITIGSTSRTYTPGAMLPGVTVGVGVKIEVGALTLLNLVALPGVDIPISLGVESGDSMAVVPLPGVSVEIGLSLIGRQVDVVTPDPRRQRAQWRYVMTDLANVPIGELTDLEHDPVDDGVGEPTAMQFTIATDSDQHALIKPIERQCQVWDGDRLVLRGPILPGQPSDDGTTMTYKIHDPSWFWRDGRRVITRTPQKNLLHNGDFKSGLTYWTRGYDKDSIPKAAPNVRVVTEDFADDTDGLDPIKAAEIFGVESVTESELSSNAVFWPNLATFRPGGKAAIETVANAMPTTAGLKVTVIGHTANDGTGNGLGLSKRRAQAAAAIIHGKRPGAVITTKGVGFYDPKPGFPVDSQEQRRVVIQYDQTITGKSKQWMKQTVEVTHPKSARYGLELTAGAMLKVADDWSVEDANMMSVRLVARRKSAPTKIFDEGSASISDTDPVDRWIPQATSVTIPADDRAYLVDVYLYAPAAVARYTSVGLFPEEQLYFWGVDQALIFKGVMEHIQKPEFGYADLGVGTRTPLTGIRRDREFAFRELTPADTALDGLMGISRGIEWDTVTTATSTTVTTFYPRQGKTVDYVLVQGGNVAQAVPANTRDVGSAIIAQAQNLGSYRAVAYASDKKAFGGTLIQRVITAEQDTPLNELGETAKAELFWAKSSTPAYWVDIDPDSIEEVLASTAKGDTVRLILDHPSPVDRLARIVRRQIHPDSLRLMVAFEEA